MAQPPVFISYVRENKDIVDRLAIELQTLGIKVWLDRNNIMPGQYWKDAINRAIQDGAFFVACYSKELNERQDGYVHAELRLAIDRLRNMPRDRVWFIPVMLNETEIPSHRISDHETMKELHTVALYDNWGNGLAMILQAMKLEDEDPTLPPFTNNCDSRDELIEVVTLEISQLSFAKYIAQSLGV